MLKPTRVDLTSARWLHLVHCIKEINLESAFPRAKLSFESGMDFFRNAAAVRLRSHHDKYLTAEENEEDVTQDRSGSSRNARWTVEFVPAVENVIRLKSSYNRYLTATNLPFLLGMTGRKVLQTVPKRLDSSIEWEPIREGNQVKLKTRYGNFLRGNGGLPPWRNSVTHDVPHRTMTQDLVLWDVELLEIQDQLPREDSSRSESFASSGSFLSNEGSERVETKMEGRTVYVGDSSSPSAPPPPTKSPVADPDPAPALQLDSR